MADDVSFKPKPEKDIHSEIDEKLLGLHNRDKIKLLNEVKENPPEPGEMEVEIKEGIYAIDLNTLLAAQLSDCPATVIPMLIDHGVRTAVDIKDTYRAEKRKLAFEYWWVIFLIIGMGAGLMLLNMLFHIF